VWCLTEEQSRQWCTGRGRTLDESGHPFIDAAKYSISAPLSAMNWSRLTWLSNFIARSLEPYDECLMWVTQWGVWSSSENLHLFYRLRETYGERRPLYDAPGHLFLNYEGSDLTSFIELGLLFGWDFYLLPNLDYARAFVSHDEFLEFRTDSADTAKTVGESLEGSKTDRSAERDAEP